MVLTTPVWLLACVGAFVLGRLYQVAVRAWHDYRMTKAQVPVLRRAAITATRGVIGTAIAAVVIAGITLYATASEP